MQDKEILESIIGGITVREMTSLTFLQWVSSKMNGLNTYTGRNQELVAALSSPPLSGKMPESEKIRLVRKLLELGVELI